MACEYPGPADTNDGDEDGEDSDDWVPSLAACKSTCVGTCLGIVWSSPTSPTSCTKCGAGMKWTNATDAAKTTVHRRQESGATQPSHCALCTDGLTWVATDGGITGPPARRHPQSPSRVARSRRLIVDKTMDVVNTTRQLRHWQLPPPVYAKPHCLAPTVFPAHSNCQLQTANDALSKTRNRLILHSAVP